MNQIKLSGLFHFLLNSNWSVSNLDETAGFSNNFLACDVIVYFIYTKNIYFKNEKRAKKAVK
jgi:hypothetical protein